MKYSCTIISLELTVIFFFLVQFYQSEGWLTRSSYSILFVLILLFFLITLSFLCGKAIASPKNPFEKSIQTRLLNPRNQQILLYSISGVITLALVGLIFFREALHLRTFALLHLDHILIGVVFFSLESILILSGLRFARFGRILVTMGSLIEKYGIVLIFLAFTIGKIVLLVPIIHNFQLYNDTLLYSQMARQISQGYLSILDYNHYPPFYPIAIHPIFFLNPRLIYSHVIILNSIIATSSVFPIYLLARSFLDKKKSLLFAFVSACIPAQLFYSALIMSENVAYPLFFWALFFCFVQPKTPRRLILWDILAGVSIGLLWVTRYMTITLIPVYLLIWWIRPSSSSGSLDFKPSRQKVLRLVLMSAVILGIFMLWVIPGILQGVDLKYMLGLTVEGKGTFTPPESSEVLFWCGISLAYLVLMANPILHQLIGRIGLTRHSESLDDAGERVRHAHWYIAVTLFTLSLMFVVTRHAWLASYNRENPQNYLSRYIVFLPVLLWFTGMIALKNSNFSIKRILVSGVLAFAILYGGIQYLLNQRWLVAEFLYSGSIDLFTITAHSIPYLVILGVFIAITSVFAIVKNTNAVFHATIFFIALINLGAWPKYLSFLENGNVYGRQLHEVITQILDDPQRSYMLANKEKIELLVPWYENIYYDELDIRGIDPAEMEIIRSKFEMVYIKGCQPEFILRYDHTEAYILVTGGKACKISPADQISQFTFNGESYKLLELQDSMLKEPF